MGVILLKQTTGTSTSGGSGSTHPTYTEAEKLILEMEMEFKTSNLNNYKELTYDSNENLTNVSIWYDSNKVLKLFNKDLSYNNDGYLSSTLLERISDNTLLLRTFDYTNGNLTSVTTSASI